MTVTGNGSPENPWVVSVPPSGATIVFEPSDDITFATTGTGTPADPLTVTADVACIDCALPGDVGDVLTLQADGTYAPMPVSAAPGAINVGAGIEGDGTLANPLRVQVCTYADIKNPALCA